MIERSLRVLVIDDEALARQRLSSLLSRVPDVEIVAECQNGLEAVGGSFLFGNFMCVSGQILRELPPPPP